MYVHVPYTHTQHWDKHRIQKTFLCFVSQSPQPASQVQFIAVTQGDCVQLLRPDVTLTVGCAAEHDPIPKSQSKAKY